jgi:hypothetical protein
VVTRASEPILVTTAPQSPREEQAQRQRRYLVTMAIRVVAFVMAIVLVALDLRWEAGIAVAASLVLPWIAVVAANAGPRRTPEADPSLLQRAQRQIES